MFSAFHEYVIVFLTCSRFIRLESALLDDDSSFHWDSGSEFRTLRNFVIYTSEVSDNDYAKHVG